jgi:hypothetical protein
LRGEGRFVGGEFPVVFEGDFVHGFIGEDHGVCGDDICDGVGCEVG